LSEIALQTVGLVRRVQGEISHTLVDGIDLSVQKGEFLAITGPSGSGKSSLLYLLGLLDAPTEGEVIICGQATSKLSEIERADVRLTKCGFVFQFHFLLPEFTALDNVLLPMRAAGQMSVKDMNERAMGLLTSLGLGEQTAKRPNQLSGGQRQRVALARALANRPEIIEERKPLAVTARRAGWIGSKILLDRVPESGKIHIVQGSVIRAKEAVLAEWQKTLFLRNESPETRGWLLDVMNCVESLGKREFTLDEVYSFHRHLSELYPGNQNVKPKIRQQLQYLRDRGFIDFVSRGNYRLRA